MSYYFSKTLPGKTFEEAKELVTENLKKEGFGILTEIDVQATLKKKIDADISRYTILGACTPTLLIRRSQQRIKSESFCPAMGWSKKKPTDRSRS